MVLLRNLPGNCKTLERFMCDEFPFRKLRTGFGGLLRMNPAFAEYGLKDLLPLKLDIPDEGCTRPNNNMFCFEAGTTK